MTSGQWLGTAGLLGVLALTLAGSAWGLVIGAERPWPRALLLSLAAGAATVLAGVAVLIGASG